MDEQALRPELELIDKRGAKDYNDISKKKESG